MELLLVYKRLMNLLANRQHEQQLVTGSCRGGVCPPENSECCQIHLTRSVGVRTMSSRPNGRDLSSLVLHRDDKIATFTLGRHAGLYHYDNTKHL